MLLKWIFDRVVSLLGLLILWPVLLVVAILIKVKMPGGPVLFVQKRVGKDGKLFNCHKFRTMIPVKNNEGSTGKKGDKGWSTVSVAGDSRITPLGLKLRHYKLDELPGDDRDVLKLRPGITGPATMKYRLEDEMIAEWVAQIRSHTESTDNTEKAVSDTKGTNHTNRLTQEEIDRMSDQELAVWYNDNVIYPDKVRLNCYYYRHYSFVKDIQMILCTVLGKRMAYAGEEI